MLRSCRSTGSFGIAAGWPARSSGACFAGMDHGRSVQSAARLVAILKELELVSLDRELQALTVLDGERTALDRSAIHRAATARYEDGQRFLLETATTPTDAPPPA